MHYRIVVPSTNRKESEVDLSDRYTSIVIVVHYTFSYFSSYTFMCNCAACALIELTHQMLTCYVYVNI